MTESGFTNTDERAGTPAFSDEKVLPIVVHALYLLGFATGGVSAIVGLIIAYVGLGEHDWRRSHYLHAVYTFWLAVAGAAVSGALLVVGIPLSFIIIGIPLVILGGLGLTAVTVWAAVRVVVALIYASKGEAYPRPRTWLV